MNRRADLDGLRVIAFGLLILYHAGMPWSGWRWHIESGETLPWLAGPMVFVNRWRMPLVFMVSGGAIVLALGQRTPLAFVRDRLRRLLLPLLFGMLVIVPPQVYIERHHSGQFAGSFLQWLPQAYAGVYPAGNLSWHHLWFVAYVLVLSFVLLPLFLWARAPTGQAMQEKTASAMNRWGLHWLMVLPLVASRVWLAPVSHNINGLIGDWHGLAMAALMLLYGGFVLGTPAMLALLNRQRWRSLAVGIVAFAAFELGSIYGLPRPIVAVLSSVDTMAWLFTIVGFANRHLQRHSRLLTQATEAVYPFYILHQTVMVIAVYGLLTWRVPSALAYALTVLATFGGTGLIYAVAVRPWPWVRPLFGMRPLPRRAALPASTAAL